MKSWQEPQNLVSDQLYLFNTPTDEVLARLRVSHDEANRWLDRGWLSFDVEEVDEVDPPREFELQFISELARSGLNDAVVTDMLGSLQKPYRYNPYFIAYSFSQGWVSPIRYRDPFEVVDENVERWLRSLAEHEETQRLMDLHELIAGLLDELGCDNDEEDEDD